MAEQPRGIDGKAIDPIAVNGRVRVLDMVEGIHGGNFLISLLDIAYVANVTAHHVGVVTEHVLDCFFWRFQSSSLIVISSWGSSRGERHSANT